MRRAGWAEVRRAAAGPDAVLTRYNGPERFDILPLLVATDGAVNSFSRDVRRLRPNIVIDGVDGMDEITWPGAELHIGDVVIALNAAVLQPGTIRVGHPVQLVRPTD